MHQRDVAVVVKSMVDPYILDVNGAGSNGCVKAERDVMITLKDGKGSDFHFIDIFITDEEANRLKNLLDTVITNNIENNDKLILEK